MKALLELIWNDPIVRCPRHVTMWTHDKPQGKHSERATGELEQPIYYSKGKRVELRDAGKRDSAPADHSCGGPVDAKG